MIVETLLFAGMTFVLPTRRSGFCDFEYATGATACNVLQISSGRSLERQVMDEFEEIAGIDSVSVKSTQDGLEVHVVLDTFNFASYEKVINKELDLSERFPSLTIKVNVDPLSASEKCCLANAA